MKVDVTSMFFNSKIEGQTATPAWGTSIGQNQSRECRIDDYKKDVVDMVIGMTYRSIPDRTRLDVSKGSSSRDTLMAALFTDVYINEEKLENSQYVLILVREHSKSHEGRLIISYAPYISYNNIPNQSCIDKMRNALGCTENGCWFVYDITIVNQSELHFKAVVVNPTAPMIYKNSKSQKRSEEWRNLIPEEEHYSEGFKKSPLILPANTPQQIIYYGAPGTGKSFAIKELTKGGNVIRTTFHPDSDYSTFVGAYKPTTRETPRINDSGVHVTYHEGEKNGKVIMDNEITYEFVDQAFLQAYIEAWKEYCSNQYDPQPVFLIIEEINRGNCAQIFGDLFQLLDRNSLGFSDYPIKADSDISKHLGEIFKNINLTLPHADLINNMFDEEDTATKVLSGDILLLPSNFYIWATMNTSDQSLFPIDSAFKRRWDWKYVPITEALFRDEDGNVIKDENGKPEHLDWVIKIDKREYDWWSFLQKVNNDVIYALTSSEDKKLGYFFCKAKSGVISAETFTDKVIFYLWNEVFKDSPTDELKCLKNEDDKEHPQLTFQSFYTEDENGKTIVNERSLNTFLTNLGVEIIVDSASSEKTEQATDKDSDSFVSSEQ
jgi:hypothetical protein